MNWNNKRFPSSFSYLILSFLKKRWEGQKKRQRRRRRRRRQRRRWQNVNNCAIKTKLINILFSIFFILPCLLHFQLKSSLLMYFFLCMYFAAVELCLEEAAEAEAEATSFIRTVVSHWIWDILLRTEVEERTKKSRNKNHRCICVVNIEECCWSNRYDGTCCLFLWSFLILRYFLIQ